MTEMMIPFDEGVIRLPSKDAVCTVSKEDSESSEKSLRAIANAFAYGIMGTASMICACSMYFGGWAFGLRQTGVFEYEFSCWD
jgi:hypothetical protein